MTDTSADVRRGPVADDWRISCVAVERRFGRKRRVVDAVGPIDLEVPDGQFLCLVGPSGCGKSTLLRIVAGLTRPSAGEVTLQVSSPSPLAMVFQDYGVYPWKTVIANVRFGLDCAGVPADEADRRARDWLERIHLTDFADAWPDQLSGGMRQRVALARALVTEPEILLLDEPFAALDPQLRSVMQEELLALSQTSEPQPTVIMVTHSLEEAVFLADRVVVLSARPGRVLVDRDIPFERPRQPSVRDHAAFGDIQRELWSVLRDEVLAQMPGEVA
jgi:NitT/TauT family transport system ATP-binding protein